MHTYLPNSIALLVRQPAWTSSTQTEHTTLPVIPTGIHEYYILPTLYCTSTNIFLPHLLDLPFTYIASQDFVRGCHIQPLPFSSHQLSLAFYRVRRSGRFRDFSLIHRRCCTINERRSYTAVKYSTGMSIHTVHRHDHTYLLS